MDNGSYNHMGTSVMRVGVITLGSMYRPDGVRFSARLVDTATQPGGQFRGYGTPQVSLAMEQQVDEIAERLGIDPIALRLRNLGAEHSRALCGYEVTTSRLGDCLVAVRDGLDWDRARATRPRDTAVARGWGVAAGTHGSGAYAYEFANRSDAALDLYADGHVRVRYGGTDAGTGQSTILAQIAAHELGLDIADVAVLSTDSERTPFELGAWSSRGTHMTGSSVGQAARELGERLRGLAAAKFGGDAGAVQLTGGQAVLGDDAVGLGDLVDLDPDAVDGVLAHETSYLLEGTEMLTPDRDTANLSPTYAFAAHGAVVDVDRRTGEVRVVDYLAAHDVGQAINPNAVEGQIVGGAAMGARRGARRGAGPRGRTRGQPELPELRHAPQRRPALDPRRRRRGPRCGRPLRREERRRDVDRAARRGRRQRRVRRRSACGSASCRSPPTRSSRRSAEQRGPPPRPPDPPPAGPLVDRRDPVALPARPAPRPARLRDPARRGPPRANARTGPRSGAARPHRAGRGRAPARGTGPRRWAAPPTP